MLAGALTLTEIVVGMWLEWGGFGYALAVRLFQRRLEVRRVREFWYMEVPRVRSGRSTVRWGRSIRIVMWRSARRVWMRR